MLTSIPEIHAKQELLFFVTDELDHAGRESIRDCVLGLADARAWLIGRPQFVNERDSQNSSDAESPIETVGGYLEIYSALPPLTLPREIDVQHLDEVTTLVDAVTQFSRQSHLTFEFELDGTFVGTIKDGKVDRSLSEGLLREWRRQLEKAT